MHLLQASTVVGGGSSNGWVMVVAVPGLTVPWSHAIYLWLATAISFCVHEVPASLEQNTQKITLLYSAPELPSLLFACSLTERVRAFMTAKTRKTKNLYLEDTIRAKDDKIFDLEPSLVG